MKATLLLVLLTCCLAAVSVAVHGTDRPAFEVYHVQD